MIAGARPAPNAAERANELRSPIDLDRVHGGLARLIGKTLMKDLQMSGRFGRAADGQRLMAPCRLCFSPRCKQGSHPGGRRSASAWHSCRRAFLAVLSVAFPNI